MEASFSLAVKIVASVCIGLLIGLEREWAHKEAGVRSFAIAALLGTLSWLITPSLAFLGIGVVVVIIVFVNLFSLREHQPLEITTSLALAATNVLGILVGMGAYFLAFSSAILVTTLLAWKTELVAFISNLTVREIRGTLLLAFVTAVVYPLLPVGFVDPWQLVNPRAVWLTIMIVSGLSFVNYVLLRQFGRRGMRYSAVLGGLVSSVAMSALLGNELKRDPATAKTVTSNFLFADLSMIVRDSVLVAIFSVPFGLQGSFAVFTVLFTMMIAAAATALVVMLRSEKKTQEAPQKPPLRSPLSLRSVLAFGALFFSLAVVSGLGQKFFGVAGFLVVVIIGAVASTASSAVLIGAHIHLIGAAAAALTIFLAVCVGLTENVVVFYAITRDRTLGIRLTLLSMPIVLLGALALVLQLG